MEVTIYYREEGDPATATQQKTVGVDRALETIQSLCRAGFVIVSMTEARLS